MSYRRHLPTVLLGLVAALLALLLVPPTSAETNVGRIEVSLRPGPGRTHVETPPLGSVTFNTHSAPLGLHIELSRLELRRVGATLTDQEPSAVLDSTRDQLHWAFVRHAVVLLVLAAGIGALLGATRRHRSRARILASAAVSAATLVMLGVTAVVGFSADAFSSPSFNGPLSEAPAILRKFDTALSSTAQIGDRLDAVTRELELLASPLEQPKDVTTVLHVTDLHSNPVGVQWVNELVERFGVDAVIDTGDITSFGYAAESAAVERPLTVPRERYHIVFGNHDAPEVRERLSRRLDPIDRRVVRVGEVTILGQDDPTFTAKEGTGRAEHDPLYRKAGTELAAMCKDMKPIVVAVHHPDLAETIDGCAAVVMAGHWHVPSQHRLRGGTLVLVGGTSGAGGVEGLSPDGVYHAQLLRFDGTTLIAVDLLRMKPTTGELEVTRVNPARITYRASR